MYAMCIKISTAWIRVKCIFICLEWKQVGLYFSNWLGFRTVLVISVCCLDICAETETGWFIFSRGERRKEESDKIDILHSSDFLGSQEGSTAGARGNPTPPLSTDSPHTHYHPPPPDSFYVWKLEPPSRHLSTLPLVYMLPACSNTPLWASKSDLWPHNKEGSVDVKLSSCPEDGHLILSHRHSSQPEDSRQ